MHQYQGKTVWGICGGAVGTTLRNIITPLLLMSSLSCHQLNSRHIGGLELPRRKARNGLVLAVTASHISAATERAIQLIRPDEVVHAGGTMST
jgi:hypothetical protein